jgi:putative SOS response-associated peptidase YedK
MSEMHDRQPVTLQPSEYSEWLTEDETPSVHPLRILPEGDLVIDRLDFAKIEMTPELPEPGLFDKM